MTSFPSVEAILANLPVRVDEVARGGPGSLGGIPTWALVAAGILILVIAGFAVWTWLGPRIGGRPKP